LETKQDDNVRNCNELDPDDVEIRHPDWNRSLAALVKDVGEQLGLGASPIRSALYKVLLYGPGQHFKEFHKDTEKEEGMFGTLVVQLPSAHRGGSICFRFNGQEEEYDFGVAHGEAQYWPHFAAHYADVDHKVKVVSEGHRLVLIYNLVWGGGGETPTATTNSNREQAGLRICERWSSISRNYFSDQFLLWLEHDYTSDSLRQLGASALKGRDREYGRLMLGIAKSMVGTLKLRVAVVIRDKTELYLGDGDDYRHIEWYAKPEEVEVERTLIFHLLSIIVYRICSLITFLIW